MEKYEQLKDYVSNKKLKYRNEFETIKREIAIISDDDLDAWRSIATRLQDCISNLSYAKRREIRLQADEQEVRAMLEGFYDNGDIFRSWVYHAIFKDSSICREPVYSVGDKYFKTLEEAKEYSISLGTIDNWLENAYTYL